MKINILLPYKEKFDENKASSVSITVRNNLLHSNYINQIKIFGQNVENPLFKDNFIGLKYSILSFKSKNKFLASKMIEIVAKDHDKKQLIEVHNRPYLIDQITKGNNFPISLFLHNDPQTMKGSKSVKDRENIIHKCSAIFCVSEYIKKKFLEGINQNFQKVHVLHNGVERKLKRFPKKKKEVIFVGRLVPEKGVDIYIDAIKPLVSKFTDWSFGLIGSSKLGSNINQSNYSKDIINKFRRIGNQAIFYGFRDNLFVQEKMKDTSIIVIPSLWEEPFGLVAAEAMSNGVAIIASDVGGIPEIIEANGILIKNINSSKIKKSLISLIENKNERKLLQKKAWKNFKVSSFNSSKNLDRHRKFIFNSINQ